jgi:hypothetical protein
VSLPDDEPSGLLVEAGVHNLGGLNAEAVAAGPSVIGPGAIQPETTSAPPKPASIRNSATTHQPALRAGARRANAGSARSTPATPAPAHDHIDPTRRPLAAASGSQVRRISNRDHVVWLLCLAQRQGDGTPGVASGCLGECLRSVGELVLGSDRDVQLPGAELGG